MSANQQALIGYGASEPTPVTIYSYSSTNNNTGLNWNGASDFYAWSFTATASWTPTELVLRHQTVNGTPVGNFYIKADKTAASTTYASAIGHTTSSGTDTIALTGWTTLTSWVQYWILYERTSDTSNFFRIYNEYSSPPAEQLWRSSASNIDPNTRYDSGSKNIGISFNVNWTT